MFHRYLNTRIDSNWWLSYIKRVNTAPLDSTKFEFQGSWRNRKDMAIYHILLLFFFISRTQSLDVDSSAKITIMFSHRNPFVIDSDQNLLPRGLDVSIVENFAKKYKLHTKYIRSNGSLNSVFHEEQSFNNFTKTVAFKWELHKQKSIWIWIH